ncbi:putative uncharacterized protein [Staphylococcus sp. CAG:324]|jgi:hypothetical protein|nr:hypothetical protein [Bacilli bacterium]MBS6563144.1 hypothetical protein [Staphylococcus sp.]CDC71551.1 putative uncharacterized protein [Staphylococcus sp. CAG:324]
MNNNQEQRTLNNLKKNKPSIVLPIINTVFSVIFLAGSIYCKIAFKEQYALGYFIAFNILVILFPITSWYNSYFSKKQNIKKIKNYDHETKEIVSYIKRLQSFKGIELNKDYKIKVTYELTDQIIDKTPHYDMEHCSLGLAQTNAIIITMGVGFSGLELKAYNQEVIGLCGVLPRSVWYKKHLKVPTAKRGKIKLEPIGFEFNEKMVVQALKNQDTYYDNKTGWTLIGERKATPLDEVIEIMTDVYVVIRDQELVSLWMKIEPSLAI